jgi:hypothetical protein
MMSRSTVLDHSVDRPSPSASASPPMPLRMSRRGDLLTAVFSAWLIFGVFLDGWAHNTRPSLESFFTPWHAVFYSGFLATAGWIAWAIWCTRRSAGLGVTLPVGYGLAACGLVVFGASGIGDMLWHLTFGVERDLAALLSPTHLGLFLGTFLIVTAPVRSAWADPADVAASWRSLLPAAVSLTLAGCLTAFILQPFHPFAYNFVSRRLTAFIVERYPYPGFVTARNIEVGLAGFILATVFLFGPVLVLLRRWRPPVGMIAAMVGIQCLLLQGVRGFRDPSLALLGGLGALAVDGLAWALRLEPTRLGRQRVFCAVAPPLFWAIYLAGVAVQDHGLGWRAELWGGTLVWTGLTLLAPTMLMSQGPACRPSPPPRDDPA